MDSGISNMGDLAITQSANVAAPVNLARMPGKAGDVDKASKDFEGMFMSQMLQPMFEGLDVDPLFGGGQGEKVMRSFLVQEYGKLMSKGGHLGIADAVKNEMIKAQGSSASASGSRAPRGTIAAKYAAQANLQTVAPVGDKHAASQ